ncbi:MAG: phosphoglycerate kinase [Chitinophagales bacterium]
MKTIADFNFKDKKVLMRVDFNVPISAEWQVSDNTRIQAALPSIKKILADGGSLVLMSHLGRPKGKVQGKLSLRNILSDLSKLLGQSVGFIYDCVGDDVKKSVANMKNGDVLLLENLRFQPAEKKGDVDFAKALADLGCDVYVNDAFGTAHRAHASTYTVAQFFETKMFGFLMAKEIENAKKVLDEPQRPFTAILGGAKVSDKILLIETLLDKVDNIIIGGGMAYTFHKAQGGIIGGSLVENDKLDLAKRLLEQSTAKGVRLLIPEDSIVADSFSNEAETKVANSNAIVNGWMGLDIGEKAIAAFSEVILQSKTIFWNGPMGVFEMESFEKGTKAIAYAVAEASQKHGAFSLIGGGDSVAAIKKFELGDKVSYVSTGGGAMLELFEGKELYGIQAIK